MDIILIAGLWLPRSIWADVDAELKQLGHRVLPVALPGVDDASTTATLADQVAATLAAVDAADRPMVVGHSAACTLAWMMADQRPDAIDRVVLVGGFPSDDGEAYADFFPIIDGVMAFPGWGPFEGPDAVRSRRSRAGSHRLGGRSRPRGCVQRCCVLERRPTLRSSRSHGVP